jgi:zinc protease
VLTDFGYVSASAEMRPELVDGFYKTLAEIVAEMKAGKFSDDLLKRARTPMIKSAETDRRGNGFWLGALEDVQSEARALAAIRSQIKDLKTITKTEIVAVANAVLDDKRRVEVRVLPKDLAAAGGGAPVATPTKASSRKAE